MVRIQCYWRKAKQSDNGYKMPTRIRFHNLCTLFEPENVDRSTAVGNTNPQNLCARAPHVKKKDAHSTSRVHSKHEKSTVSKELQLARMRAIGTDPAIERSVNRKRIIVETERYLSDLAMHVREAKRADEASRFIRWLQFSGIINLLREEDAFRQPAEALYRQARDLLFECGELFKGGKADPKYSQCDIAEINRKLDLVTRFLDATPTGGEIRRHKTRRHRGRRM
jgi:hypothetical protein